MAFFWGSFLAFSGSVVLGIVSWKQNEKANKTNRETLKLQTRQWEAANAPDLQCFLDCYKTSHGKPYLVITIQNYGKSVATDIAVSVYDTHHEEPFDDIIKTLNSTEFSLAPGRKLSTPVGFFKKNSDLLGEEQPDVNKLLGENAKLDIKFSYLSSDGDVIRKFKRTHKLSAKEFMLFSSINNAE